LISENIASDRTDIKGQQGRESASLAAADERQWLPVGVGTQ